MQSSTPLCLFTGRVEKQNGEYVLTIPDQEIELGTLQRGDTYRIGVHPSESVPPATGDRQHEPTARRVEETDEDRQPSKPAQRGDTPQTGANAGRSHSPTESHSDQPPVTEGETLEVEIESMGEKGDGLARVGPGYVVFVSDTDVGQQPLVRITAVRENVAFAEVVHE
ncbi:TRAM domain-containing protein [Salinirubrum litoreum]|uniref:TRAM domain-containing protein n=1 Tax=Salinirubrum litoreum TaxID=1126234 RepID=A0ABD5RGD8_9EURY|nr:TRAM domain-containing protein [Salinirubrum litoreum]